MSDKWKDWLSALGGVVFLVLPRTTPALLALTGAYCIAKLPPSRSELRRLMFWTGAVIAYPLLSATWSLDWRRTLTTVAATATIAVVSWLVYQRAGRLRDSLLPVALVGIPVGVLLSFPDVLLGLPLRGALLEHGVSWWGSRI